VDPCSFERELPSHFTFRPIDAGSAHAISAWQYDPPYDFYDSAADEEDLNELLDPSFWVDDYHAVLDQRSRLVGFFSFKRRAPALLVGLGLHPELAGRGLGREFVDAGLEYAREKYQPETFMLDVATFNLRAQRVYEAAGFQPGEIWIQTGRIRVEFLRMTRSAECAHS